MTLAKVGINHIVSPATKRIAFCELGQQPLSWGARRTQARRALMIGALVALALTTAIIPHGALALNAWPAVVVGLALVIGFVWVLFFNPEPMA